MPTLTLIVVILTALISYKGFNDRAFFDKYKHHPYSENKFGQYYRFISSGFLHGSWLHLIINMFVFHEFGKFIEMNFTISFGSTIGLVLYFLFYIVSIIVADIPSFKKHKHNPGFAAIGASGGVSAILFAFIFFQPWSLLYIWGIIPIPAVVMGILYLWYSSYAAKNQSDNIDHSAHFAGALFGFFAMFIFFTGQTSNFFQKLLSGPDLSFLGM